MTTLSRPDLQEDVDAMIARIRYGAGVSPAAQRQAAVDGRFQGPLAAYLDKVRNAPTTVTDEEVAALRRTGHPDDELFEMTIATALGAAKTRLDAGLDAIAAAYGED